MPMVLLGMTSSRVKLMQRVIQTYQFDELQIYRLSSLITRSPSVLREAKRLMN